MRLNAFIKRRATSAAIAVSMCCAIGMAHAGCQVWNGCMHRVAKHLVEFRELARSYIDVSQKCIYTLNRTRSVVALQYSACIDAESYRKRVQDILDDGDVRDHLTADDKALRDGVVQNLYNIVTLANEYETPAEREAAREAAEQKLVDARAEAARSEERTAIIVGALAAGAQQMGGGTSGLAGPPPAPNALLGTLTHSEMTTSVTGKTIWSCTYFVDLREVTVLEDSQCTQGRYFE